MKRVDYQQVLKIISCPEFCRLNNWKYRQHFRHKKLVTINLHHLPPPTPALFSSASFTHKYCHLTHRCSDFNPCLSLVSFAYQ